MRATISYNFSSSLLRKRFPIKAGSRLWLERMANDEKEFVYEGGVRF